MMDTIILLVVNFQYCVFFYPKVAIVLFRKTGSVWFSKASAVPKFSVMH